MAAKSTVPGNFLTCRQCVFFSNALIKSNLAYTINVSVVNRILFFHFVNNCISLGIHEPNGTIKKCEEQKTDHLKKINTKTWVNPCVVFEVLYPGT